ncbi:hypothetical protein [Wolbachia endosymbiont of Glossina morsitans morsitans]|uniref:hypothetical protein n=1 Tax=Wolbachia endosymbiont of Glossina morsitans morsitans TaxID=1150948 RepID=UPI00056DA75C|nr:hypothetical protein [Wolbachia endosymbiont of Glossina morsitans morsitans]
MPRYVDNYVKPKYGDDTKPGGGKADLSKMDPKRIDDFSKFWKQKEEERKKQNQSTGQGSSKS